MNDWETIEKIVNTLPQWDVIKLIIGIQEELKCAKEDNLYQLRKNKDLQNRIDKVIEYIKHYETIRGYYEYQECGYDEYNYEEDLKEELLDILKESGE